MPIIGDKTTITFGTSGFTAKVISHSGPSISRSSVDVTTKSDTGTDVSATGGSLGQNWATTIFRKFLPGSIDVGESTFQVSYDPDEPIPMLSSGTNETITIQWAPQTGQTTGATFVCEGHCSGFSITGDDIDGHVVADCSIKWSGEPTFTAGS